MIGSEKRLMAFFIFNKVVQLVLKVVNKVRDHLLSSRLFKAIIDELNCQLNWDYLLWLEMVKRGSVLKIFNEAVPALTEFFTEREEIITELENEVWLPGFAFLIDVTTISTISYSISPRATPQALPEKGMNIAQTNTAPQDSFRVSVQLQTIGYL